MNRALILKALHRGEQIVVRATYGVAAVLLLLVALLMMLNVLARNYGLNISGFQGIAQIMAVWMGFLLLGTLELQNRHLRVGFLVDRLPSRYQHYLRIGTLVASLFAMLLVTTATVVALETFWSQTITGFDLPGPILHGAPLFGAVFLTAVYTKKLIQAATDK